MNSADAVLGMRIAQELKLLCTEDENNLRADNILF